MIQVENKYENSLYKIPINTTTNEKMIEGKDAI